MQIPDKYNWGKLNRVLRYVRRTNKLPLILRADSLTVIKLLIEASYAAHPDMRGHTGDTISLGMGSVTVIVEKHRINSKSSTEAELIGADDAMPQMLWTK